MPDYSKTIIYKICANDPEIKEIYVGSTCNFAKRKYEHKERCKNYNLKVYSFIRENGGWDAFEMVPIEKYPCNDKLEKTIRERYWFETLKAGLNTIYPSREKKEYQYDNAEKIKEQKKQYYIDNIDKKKENYKKNADKIKKQHKQYYADNKDKVIEQSKKYYNDNADKIIERIKQYTANNADKIKAYRSVKIVCECGLNIRRSDLAKHRKTIKHIKFIENKKE